MATLHVIKPFNLLLSEEERAAAGVDKPMLHFAAGRHDGVHKVIADHPYVAAHLGDENAAAAAIKPVSGNALAVDLDEAVRRAERAEAALADERKAHAETRARLAEMTGARDEAPASPTGELSLRHKGRGLFAVFRGEDQLTDPMPKEEASAKLSAMKA